MWEGSYAVCAQFVEGSTRVIGRRGTSVGMNGTVDVTLSLGATAIVEGTFVKSDRATPVPFAQVAVGNFGFATTDANGFFRFEGVALGTHRLVSNDPVTGAGANGTVTLSFAGEVKTVQLVETVRGTVEGVVIGSYRDGNVAGATVELRGNDGFTQARTVTTGPDGRFAFPGTPVGTFSLRAVHPTLKVPGLGAVSGTSNGSLAESQTSVFVEVPLQALGVLPVRVTREDGSTPAPNIAVNLFRSFGSAAINVTADTNPGGGVTFRDLPLVNGYRLTAISTTTGELRNGVVVFTNITAVGTNAGVVLRLPGVGSVSGTVLASDATMPVAGAEVVLRLEAAAFAGEELIGISDATGAFGFDDIPVGPYRLSASSVSLGTSTNGLIASAGQADNVTLVLGASGSIEGRIVRADGVTPAAGIEVLFRYNSQSVNPGRAVVLTGADGHFIGVNLPVGRVNVSAAAVAFGGLVERNVELTSNGQLLDLGTLRMDEANPAVLAVTPPFSAVEVPITTTVELLFSEALATNSISTNGIFLRSVANGLKVGATVELLETNAVPRLVRLTPAAPLVSERTYEVVVIAGDLLSATGGLIGSGPRDLVGRPLVVPFVSRFTTADNDPPVLLSLFPSNNAVQIDTRAVPRLSFNEAIRPTGASFKLTGPQGEVAGTTSVGVDGRVLSFVPTDLLKPNTSYTLTVNNVLDLAGNRATNEPYVATFATLDTIGPAIATLRIGDGLTPLAGRMVPVEAVLAVAEPGVNVRFTQDFNPAGSTTNVPYRRSITLPLTGSTTVRAIATDRFGNDGPFAELVISVQANQPPTIQFTRVTPISGSAPSGSFVAVDVTANDDSAIGELRAIVAGIGAGNLASTNSNRLRVQGFVSAQAGPGSQVQIFADAKDDIGQSSGQQVFTLPISDGTKPTLAVNSPAAQSTIQPGATVPVTLQLNDNFGVSRVDLAVTGAFTTAVQTALSPVITNGLTVVDLDVPATAPTNHQPVLLSLTARDTAGNVSALLNHTLRMIDTTAPTIVSIIPGDGATGVDPQAGLEIVFSEPLATNSIAAGVLTLAPDGGGPAIDLSLALLPDLRTLRATFAAPLAIDTRYRLMVASTITDVSGNALGANSVTTFRTGDFRLTSPVQGQQVVEGQAVTLAAESSTLTFNKVRFLAGATELAIDVTAPFSTNHTIPTLAELGGSTLTFTAEALDAADAKLAEATATVNVFAADVDSDGDGVTNGEELIRGTNPFKPDALPVINFPDTIEIVQGVLTNFPVNATDADGNLRELRVRESAASGSRGGLIAEFRNLTFTPSAMSQVDFGAPPVLTMEVDAIAFPNTTSAPWPGAPVQSVQVASRFLGRLLVPAGGSHQFRLASDDGAEVLVDGAVVVGRPNGAGSVTASATLAAGGHAFELRHFNGGGPGNLTLEWSGPGFGMRVLTKDDFSGLELLRFAETGTLDLATTNDVATLDATLEIQLNSTNAVALDFGAIDSDGLMATKPVSVVTLGDLDGDTIPDRDDPDIDGDGVSNADELLAGTDPRKADTDGDSLPDGTDNNPLVANSPPVAGVAWSGSALRFDGTDDFVEMSAGVVPSSGQFTVEVWARLETAPDSFREILSQGSSGNAFYLGTDPANELRVGDGWSVTGVAYPVGGWHHFAVVRLATDTLLYIDGALIARRGAAIPNPNGSTAMRLGRQYGGNSEYWPGDIAEVRIWNRAISHEELRGRYQRALDGNEPGLVGYWPGAEDSGVTLVDASPSRINGSLGGGSPGAFPIWINAALNRVVAPRAS
ncbi:MAG TPA: hypothetical protein DCY13_13985, partial [Verrucomicrobiales bacterium]|nr:hypothetical protein [Verrucomicrobiales bacterium]